MATMFAYQAFDYRDLDLYQLNVGQTDVEFLDNVNQVFNGITYQDVVYVEHSYGYIGSYFGGYGITFDANDNVVNVDRTGMELVARISPVRQETPTLGRERSFFEDLFGNIGQVGTGAAAPGGGR